MARRHPSSTIPLELPSVIGFWADGRDYALACPFA
jgi:hypothetical protein